MSRCTAWRTASGSLGNAIEPEQLAWAELFEDSIQALRLRRLRHVFGEAIQVRFAPQSCTLQDRCLLASTVPLAEGLLAMEDRRFVEKMSAGVAALLADV